MKSVEAIWEQLVKRFKYTASRSKEGDKANAVAINRNGKQNEIAISVVLEFL